MDVRKHAVACRKECASRVKSLPNRVNFAASLKIPEDALVRCGILSDDNPSVVRDVFPEQVRVHHRPEQGIHLRIVGTVVAKAQS